MSETDSISTRPDPEAAEVPILKKKKVWPKNR